MSQISTQVSIDVFADPDYFFRVHGSGNMFEVEYREEGRLPSSIGFASKEEMIAVAKAMLKVCEMGE